MSNGNYKEVSVLCKHVCMAVAIRSSCSYVFVCFKMRILYRLQLRKGGTSTVPYRESPVCLAVAAMRLTTGTYQRINSEWKG